MALLPGSPAISAGLFYNPSQTDQRGLPRSYPSDIGAIEVQGKPNQALGTKTVTVTTLADSLAPDVGVSLRDAIIAANSYGDKVIINFAPNLSGTITLGSALPNLDGNIEIDGPGADLITVSGADLYQIFHVDGVATISGLTLVHGLGQPLPNRLPDTLGGAVVNLGDLTISNCTFLENSAVSGGAIENSGTASQLQITNCQFGDGIAADANSASAGGAIGNFQGQVIASGSTFNGNTATISGGAIDNAGGGIDDPVPGGSATSPGTMTVDTSTFTDNSALSGGAFENFESNATITSSTFVGNSAFFQPNQTGVAAGGAIENYDGVLNVINCTLTGNSAVSSGNLVAVGGAIENFQQNLTATLNLTNTTIARNSATSFGGGIDNNSTVNLANTIVTNDVRGPSSSPIPGDISGTVTANNSLIQIIRPTTLSATSANNITGVDPLLGPLANNGGPTQTMALLPGSPAIDKGINSLAVDSQGAPLTTDQRGASYLRKVGTVDIGAFEVQAPATITPVITWTNPADIIYGTLLETAQLDATANVPGTFVYNFAIGAVLQAGQGQTLSVTFTPTDITEYATVTDSVTINVNRAVLTIIATTNIKTYDSTTNAAATPTVSGLVGNDSVTGLAEVYSDPNAGTSKTLSVSSFTVNDSNSGKDYTVMTISTTSRPNHQGDTDDYRDAQHKGIRLDDTGRCRTDGDRPGWQRYGDGTDGSTCERQRGIDPGVSAVTSSGKQIGNSASRVSSKFKTVTLAPGKQQSSSIGIVDTGNFSPSTCAPVTAAGLKIFPPNQSQSVTIKKKFSTCSSTTTTSLSVRPIK